jgi:hypothetical protein
MALASTIWAQHYICPFIGLDGCHTKSRFRMQLLIAVGIDANDRALPLAVTLVPIENEYWWTWFCTHFNDAFEIDNENMFILDKEKGLEPAIHIVFPKAFHAHYY